MTWGQLLMKRKIKICIILCAISIMCTACAPLIVPSYKAFECITNLYNCGVSFLSELSMILDSKIVDVIEDTEKNETTTVYENGVELTNQLLYRYSTVTYGATLRFDENTISDEQIKNIISNIIDYENMNNEFYESYLRNENLSKTLSEDNINLDINMTIDIINNESKILKITMIATF